LTSFRREPRKCVGAIRKREGKPPRKQELPWKITDTLKVFAGVRVRFKFRGGKRSNRFWEKRNNFLTGSAKRNGVNSLRVDESECVA